jgi:hypothetical protein
VERIKAWHSRPLSVDGQIRSLYKRLTQAAVDDAHRLGWRHISDLRTSHMTSIATFATDTSTQVPDAHITI